MTPPDESALQNSRTRVLVVNVADLLAQFVVQEIAQQPDLKLIGQVEGTIAALLTVRVHDVDVVILGAPQIFPVPKLGRRLLRECPDLKLIVLSPSSDVAMIYWLAIRRRRLARVSTQTMAHSIRQAMAIEPIS